MNTINTNKLSKTYKRFEKEPGLKDSVKSLFKRQFTGIHAVSNFDLSINEGVDYFIELFGVSELLNVQVRTLSLGERMKMELIVALLHNPRVLFLDEPTIGLDAVAQRQMRTFLSEFNKTRGTTILLTSHYMEDVTKLMSALCCY